MAMTPRKELRGLCSQEAPSSESYLGEHILLACPVKLLCHAGHTLKDNSEAKHNVGESKLKTLQLRSGDKC
jgi:hypothetical protein